MIDYPESDGVGVPQSDKSGVDLEQIEYQLSLTPAERLTHLEQFAEDILIVWRTRGIEWLGSEKFSGD